VGANRYNILNGVGEPHKWSMLPNFGAHTARIPIHILENGPQRKTLLNDQHAFYRPPVGRCRLTLSNPR
jgi:hypothetical protein